MNNNFTNKSKAFKLIALGLFDLSLILGFFNFIYLYQFISLYKTIFIIFGFIISLIVFNLIIISSSKLLKSLGTPYFIMTVFLTIIYFITTNIFMFLLISSSILVIFMWQIILLSLFIAALSAIFYLTSKINKDN